MSTDLLWILKEWIVSQQDCELSKSTSSLWQVASWLRLQHMDVSFTLSKGMCAQGSSCVAARLSAECLLRHVERIRSAIHVDAVVSGSTIVHAFLCYIGDVSCQCWRPGDVDVFVPVASVSQSWEDELFCRWTAPIDACIPSYTFDATLPHGSVERTIQKKGEDPCEWRKALAHWRRLDARGGTRVVKSWHMIMYGMDVNVVVYAPFDEHTDGDALHTLLESFDLVHCAIGFDGTRFVYSDATRVALETRTIAFHHGAFAIQYTERNNPIFVSESVDHQISRVRKYMDRGFSF